ncbi:MAG: phosphatidylserine decarboxylase [Clostridiaceae bacterium]|nr:phosphatidylserine decarboxylase [Clostridiaceae bacterium]
MSGPNSAAVRFLYGTRPGRLLLKLILGSHVDKIAVWYLRSPLSRPIIGGFARRNGIPLTPEQKKSFGSYQEFFLRRRPPLPVDQTPEILVSPCDGWLSAFPIREDSSFVIKGAPYRLEDLIADKRLARQFQGGDCLIFRLCPSDYHHYSYIDDGFQGKNHFIPGALHSVQPLACQTYPVYTLNRRCWSLLESDHFGPVIQAEIGALIVGGIVNDHENAQVSRGMEKGRFDLAGSTIVLLFQKDRVQLLPEIAQLLKTQEEYRAVQGTAVGRAVSPVLAQSE